MSFSLNNMRVLYVANVRMPTERAHGAQIVKTCEALVREGQQVELVVPRRHTPIESDAFSYYGAKDHFPIHKVPIIDTVSWGRLGFVVESISFAFSALRYVNRDDVVVYSRDEIVFAFLSFFTKRPIVWESHTGAWNFWARRVAGRAKRIVVISNGLRDFYVERGVPEEKIIVAPDAVDLEAFANPESREDARKRLGLPQDGKIALYIGDFGGWKGTDTLFEASTYLTDDTSMAVIGGTYEQVTAMKKKYPRILFLGARPYSELRDNQAAADVLVLPNTGKNTISTRFTSPLKLFTYMASGKPIAASDISSIREVLPEEGAYWCAPDDPQDLARALEEALRDPQAVNRAMIAQNQVKGYTWKARARLIQAALTHQL